MILEALLTYLGKRKGGENLSQTMFYQDFQTISRTYLDILQLRDSIDKRLKSLAKTNPSSKSIIFLQKVRNTLELERKRILKQAKKLFRNHPLWNYCKKVSGMGEIAALTILGYINPYKANTAGQAKAYCGVIPQSSMKSGVKSKHNPEAKGRIWLIARNIIMQKDSYYYPIYKQYKQRILNRGFKKILKNPSICPKYPQCIRRLNQKAARLNRQPKQLPCKKHLDNMAKRFLMGLIISHCLELLRQHEGLSIAHFKSHKHYIPPKP